MGMSRAAMLWPGVPQLWLRGEVRGLLHAAWFACLFNGVWLATVAWPDLLGPWTLRACWFVVIGASIFAAIWAMRHWQAWEAGNMVTEEGEAQFEEAQTHYLSGDYFEAEAALHRIFTSGKQDVEAAILMVSILRRTKRYAQALYCIEKLLLLDNAMPWHRELLQEQGRVRRLLDGDSPKALLSA